MVVANKESVCLVCVDGLVFFVLCQPVIEPIVRGALVFIILAKVLCPILESALFTLVIKFDAICECSAESGSACKNLKFHKF